MRSPSPEGRESASQVLRIAESWVGLEFKPGHREQCAAFIRAVFAEAGLSLPVASSPSDLELTRDLPQGPALANSLSSDEVGWAVDLAGARAGDLILFTDTYEGDFPPGCITHVGLYAGEGEMVHRSTAAGPVERVLLDRWWRDRVVEVRRPHELSGSGARQRLARLCQGHWIQRSVTVAVELGIAELLEERPLTLVELADRRSVHVSSLERLMRGLSSIGLFTLDSEDRYRITGLSQWLLPGRSGSLRDYALARGRSTEWKAWLALRAALESGGSLRAPSGDPPRAWIGAVAQALCEHFELARSDRLVDLGGHQSGMMFEVLPCDPRLQAVVRVPREDVEAVRQAIQARGLEGRLEVWAGESSSASLPDGDFYLLPLVLSSMDHSQALELLGRLREKPGRVVLVEVLEEESAFLDLQMLVLGMAERECSTPELEELCGDAGFSIARVVTTITPLGLLELVRTPTQEN
ncbi:MAG: C40 family peptidase [Armatimonadetes bacterium]|nr:C40 family peptidase [Armatimonadota bacterium]